MMLPNSHHAAADFGSIRVEDLTDLELNLELNLNVQDFCCGLRELVERLQSDEGSHYLPIQADLLDLVLEVAVRAAEACDLEPARAQADSDDYSGPRRDYSFWDGNYLGGNWDKPSLQPFLQKEVAWLTERPAVITKFVWAAFETVGPDITLGRSNPQPQTMRDVFAVAVRATMAGRLGEDNSVVGIACGGGDLLCSTGSVLHNLSGVRPRLYGADDDGGMLSVAARLGRATGANLDLDRTDSIANDAFPGVVANLAVLEFLSNAKYKNIQSLSADARFPYGFGHGDATLLHAQAMLAKLRQDGDGGVGLALVAGKILSSQAAGRFREGITNQDWIRAVVSLPERLLSYTAIPTFLLVFDTMKPKNWTGLVQFVGLRSQFEIDPKSRTHRITAEGLAELARALERPKPTRLTRTVRSDALTFRTINVSLGPSTGPATQKPSTFGVVVPASIEPTEWFDARYGDSSNLVMQAKRDTHVSWNPNDVVGDDRERDVREARYDGWTYVPLSSLAAGLELVASSNSKGRGLKSDFDFTRSVAVPLAKQKSAIPLTSIEDLPDWQCVVVELTSDTSPIFLAHWLGSDAGLLARSAAMPSGWIINVPRSEKDALRFIDRLSVPTPHQVDQRSIESALAALRAANDEMARLESQVWSRPETSTDVRADVVKFATRAENLPSWIDSLPYPLAASLWTYVTVRRDPHRGFRQLRLFFEAVTVFRATYLIAALRQDKALWEEHSAAIAALLQRQHLSFKRASFGTWRITSEYLARHFRDGLESDDAEDRARFQNLLGDPSQAAAGRILGKPVSQLLNEVNTVRNESDAHGGTISDADAERYQEVLRGLLTQLRRAMGDGWAGLQMVRVGRSEFDGDKYVYDVELLQGSSTPFAPDVFETQRQLRTGGLCLVSSTSGCLELPGFVRMGPEPDNSQNTCYFYSSMNGDKVRSVAYQDSSQTDSEQTDEVLSELIADLDGVTQNR